MRAVPTLALAALLASTTVGAGAFALPYIATKAGWLTVMGYLAGLSVLVIVVHAFYGRAIEETGNNSRLVGLVRRYGGAPGLLLSLIAIVGGLFLSLVAYIILAARFLQLTVPELPLEAGFVAFWITVTLPLLARLGWLVDLEIIGAALIAIPILLVFWTAGSWAPPAGVPLFDPAQFFLPFGAVLFALAGWTAIEPMIAFAKEGGAGRKEFWVALWTGTLASALLYALFVFGMLGSAPLITPDAVSGLAGWPAWKMLAIGALGLFAVWTSYVPIAFALKEIFMIDLGWPKAASEAAVVFAPLLLILAGFNDFLRTVSIAGGVFLSLQYLAIVYVSRKILPLPLLGRALLDLIALLFFLAAAAEIYYGVWR
jgi:amino acid permease